MLVLNVIMRLAKGGSPLIVATIMFENLFDLTPVKHLADWYFLFYLATALGIFWVAKLLNQLLAGFNLDRQLSHRDNKAVATSFMGFLFALGLIISRELTSPVSNSIGEAVDAPWMGQLGNAVLADFLNTSLWAVLGAVLLLLSRIVNDKLILPAFSNRKELLEDGNVGVGAVQAGSYIATALIITAVLGGEFVEGLLNEVALALVWFVISQVLLILFSFLYQKMTKFDMHHQLSQGNVAVGISFGGTLLAFGLMMHFYLTQYDSLLGLLVWALLISVLLFVNRFVVDKLILSGGNLDDELSQDQNWGVALIEVATSISAASIIASTAY